MIDPDPVEDDEPVYVSLGVPYIWGSGPVTERSTIE